MAPVLKFGDWRPDQSDLNNAHTQSVLNVLPRADGYGPMPGIVQLSLALGEQCRGYCYAHLSDGSVSIIAGTATRLYMMSSDTYGWTDVSNGGSAYADIPAGAQWQFAQFNDTLIAVHANVAPQSIAVNGGTAFADLGGSPPQAAYIAIVNRFVVLSGLASYPRRVQWSGLNAITTWTSGVTYSDYQDLPDGGNLKGVVGGEFGIIIQDLAVRRMTFQPGADVIFSINRIAKDIGATAPYSIIDVNGVAMFLSTKGFVRIDGSGAITPIGTERVDKTFLGDADLTAPQYIIGAADPAANLAFWTYRSTGYSGDGFDEVLAYNWTLERWAPLEIEGEYIASLAKPGVTLEGLDILNSVEITGAANNGSGKVRLTVASSAGWTTGDVVDVIGVEGTTEANGQHAITVVDGTHIDLTTVVYANAYVSGGYVSGALEDLTISLDDLSAATLPRLSICDTSHRVGFLAGDNLEATLDAAEQSGIATRIFIRGGWPITDAPECFMSLGVRDNLNATPDRTTEQAMDGAGFCAARRDTRHARPRLRIPAGTEWTFATGVMPDFKATGKR